MKYKEFISTVRNSINQISPNSEYSDSYLYSLYKIYSSSAIEKDRIRLKNEREKDSEEFKKMSFCIELIKSKAHDCNCVKVGCEVMRSKYKIPQPIGDVMLYKLDNTNIALTNPSNISTDNLDPIKGSSIRAYMFNQYVYVTNAIGIGNTNQNLKSIVVEARWEDALDWIDRQYCDDNKEDEDSNSDSLCTDLEEFELPVEDYLLPQILENILNVLRLSLIHI